MVRKLLFPLIVIILLSTGCKQSEEKVQVDSDAIAKQKQEFPKDWEGQWKGTLIISKPNGDTTQIPMQLHILPKATAGKWDYKIIYGNKTTGTRPYELHTIDASKGHYQIDEKNSIILDAYYIGNTLYSRFDVGTSLLSTRLSKQGELINYEIISGRKKPINTTGGTSDDIPEVGSYNIVVQQKALLSR